ncbi:hypothetical protein A1Q1_02811 [Trichosporon asahii var. asahii CBS 2479]|uniref:BTB domain-containing protein n=1 Tax=Trichosporon asahii var. asahii (strain ATCC 90039 / CBS 2479 / JCM 2466 / KCTC 7840 / NBRC 103889/ NCYC 2677 / UAMH 7654) TaxID=1186058 RepID=J4UBJ5_TRIAS|nr:hypothetical protein A1Q1_02811 [Trichosporon asahii var. asahii CBS 2479]EJT48245.1 hypothetical protein A1Q1_02811 [Trichosporon asahii var. asahii CBS 2479]
MAANPSHLLISRNPRSPAHPQLASTLTTSPYLFPFPTDDSTLPHVSGGERNAPRHTRSQSTPAFDLDLEDDTEPLEIHPTFRRDAEFPGRVLVIVGGYEFWCHKEVLWFASPFFNALLKGPWTETGGKGHQAHGHGRSDSHHSHRSHHSHTRSHSHSLIPSSSSHVPSSTPPDPEPAAEQDHDVAAPDTDTLSLPGKDDEQKGSVYLDAQDGPSVAEILAELRNLPEPPTASEGGASAANRLSMFGANPAPPHPATQQPFQLPEADERKKAASPLSSLSSSGVLKPKPKRASTQSGSISTPVRPCSAPAGERHRDADCVVELKEESPEAFQDFLYWAYPHLDCKATWTNVEGFLMTHASGRPVMAIALAEQHGNAELYREASRFLLDQPTWDPEEFESLSETTQLKLSKRRTWFLERLLKLGTIDVKKEYTCAGLPRSEQVPNAARREVETSILGGVAVWSAAGERRLPLSTTAGDLSHQPQPGHAAPAVSDECEELGQHAYAYGIELTAVFDRMFQPKVAFGLVTPGTEKVSCWLRFSADDSTGFTSLSTNITLDGLRSSEP